MIVLISGPPAAGKSSIGLLLRDRFGVPYVDRDRLKEHVYPLAQAPEMAEARAAASLDVWAEVVATIAIAGRSVIADPVAVRRSDWAMIPTMLARVPAEVIEVHLTAPPEVLVRRFLERRSPPLEGRLVAKVDAAIALHTEMGPLLPDGRCLEFDTADPDFTLGEVGARLGELGFHP